MLNNTAMISDPLIIGVFKIRDLIISSTVYDGHMEKIRVCITIINPINSRSQFPIIILDTKDIIVVLEQSLLEILKIRTSRVSSRFLDTAKSG